MTRTKTGGGGDAGTEGGAADAPHVPFDLFGLPEMSAELPGYLGRGDEREAVASVADAITMWSDTAGARDWFAGSIERWAAHGTARLRQR